MSFFNYFSTGLKNTLKFKNSPDISYKGDVVIVTPDVVVDRWSIGDFSSATYEIAISYGAHDLEHVNITVVARVNQASITVYGATNLGKDLVEFTATVDAATVKLIANPYATGTTGIRLIVKATYAERILPLQVPSVVGQSDNTNGAEGITLNWENSNLPNGFLTLNEYGSISISNLSSLQVSGQSSLTADFIFSKLNVQNTDESLTISTDTVTNTITVSVSRIPNLVVTGGLHVNPFQIGSINNTTFGSTVSKSATFLNLTSNGLVNFLSANQQILISPTGTGSVIVSPATAGNIDNITIGASNQQPMTVSSLTVTGNATVTQNQTLSIVPTGTGTLAINPGTTGSINRIDIGSTVPSSAKFLSVTLTTLQTQGNYLIAKSQLQSILLGASV